MGWETEIEELPKVIEILAEKSKNLWRVGERLSKAMAIIGDVINSIGIPPIDIEDDEPFMEDLEDESRYYLAIDDGRIYVRRYGGDEDEETKTLIPFHSLKVKIAENLIKSGRLTKFLRMVSRGLEIRAEDCQEIVEVVERVIREIEALRRGDAK